MKNKRAVFVCGSGGSGKSTFVKNNLSDFVHIDVDIIYEELLIENGLGLKIKNFTNSELELSTKLFEQSKLLNNEKLNNAIADEKDIVIDGIGRDVDVIILQRNILERAGYFTSMIMLYSDLEICVNRVEGRERVYSPEITITSWYLSYSNLVEYKKQFGNRFLFIYNDRYDWKSKFQIFINEYTHKQTII